MTIRNSGGTRLDMGWKLCGAALAAVVLAGCSSAHRSAPVAAEPAPTPVATAEPAAGPSPTDEFDNLPPTAPTPPAPTVNVFGEVDGVARGVARPIGDEGYKQHSFADEGYDADVVVDPTGKWMCFASTRNGQRSALYLQRTDGATVTRLTSDDSDNAFPTFSPDGKQIAFSSTRTGAWNIYTMDTEGRSVVTVTTGAAQCVHPTYSPDGTRLAYSCLGTRSRQWELWVRNISTGEPQQIGYGLFPTWCPARNGPNGPIDKIAFQRARERGSRWFSLWTLDLVDGEARHVTEVAVSSNAAIVSPTWSPDGQRLAFATVLDPSHTMGARKGRGEQDIWTIAADGTDRRRLTDGNGVNLSPNWSRDGRVYFVSNRGGVENVWSVRPEVAQTFTAAANRQPTTAPSDAAASLDTH